MKTRAPLKKPQPVLYYTLLSSPLGPIGIASTPSGICRVELNAAGEPSFRKTLQKDFRFTVIRQDQRFSNLVNALRLYFSGRPSRLKVKIDLREGTPFQQKVWRALRRIPLGQTRSYRRIAREIGHPNSFRAVGGACGKNPVAILIPCHRVIKTNGKLGGFTGGLRLKQQLLTFEHSIR